MYQQYLKLDFPRWVIDQKKKNGVWMFVHNIIIGDLPVVIIIYTDASQLRGCGDPNVYLR